MYPLGNDFADIRVNSPSEIIPFLGRLLTIKNSSKLDLFIVMKGNLSEGFCVLIPPNTQTVIHFCHERLL